ncbi:MULTISPECIES: class D sortase [unclassified Planococcus (in: firmicutes)]|uniref:class D sortase n=1 Tax=unclassified Planococcus (in: firmicutes) TaxID=2662419 RepID=UPI000C7D8B21|nr:MULTISPECIES: class D sortase [unclassified Planococcus (in: firmicutes)]PKG46692.1 class D sortase [Planococcus sp. Urea-trap-24]PKG89455.1 class D sortase [Planococcus sp. Urea-3u-39]PKH39255.1 class D sortase [Planococcus sp. MB-3u-09]
MNKKRISWLMTIAAVAMITFGLWFSGTQAATFAKGYLLYKADSVAAEDFASKLQTTNAEVSLPEAEEAESIMDPVKEQEKGEEAAEEIAQLPKDIDYPSDPQIGDLMGELIIPKLGASLPIIHGTDEDELEQGVGHYAGSVLPGQSDNSVLSGHRDTVFRELGKVGKGDEFIVHTADGTFTYRVRQVRIVDEDDRTVIVPKPRATLTVSTCYPFDFVGYAPERYILVADLVSSS